MFRTALLFLTLINLTPNAVGQEITKEITVEVRRDGKPASDATVEVLIINDANSKLGSTTSQRYTVDNLGRTKLKWDNKHSACLIGHDTSGNIGGMTPIISRLDNIEQVHQIELFPTVTYSGRFVDKNGNPIAGVQLNVYRLFKHSINHNGLFTSDHFFIKNTQESKVFTNENGQFQFRNLPKGFNLNVIYNTKMFGSGEFIFTSDEKSDIILREPGKLKIEITSKTQKLSPDDFEIYLEPNSNTNSNTKSLQSRGMIENWNTDGVAESVLPGAYTISLYPKQKSIEFLEGGQNHEVQIYTDKLTVLQLKSVPGAILKGKIIDKETKKGLSNISVQIHSEIPREFDFGTTNQDGEYTVYVRGGSKYEFGFNYSESIISAEKIYLKPPYDRGLQHYIPGAKVLPGGKHEFPTVELREARNVIGNVIDAEGKPITNAAKVYCPVQDFQMRSYQPKFTGNQFTYRGLPYDVPLTFRLRSGKAVNIPERIDPKLLNEPQTFRLSEAHGVKIVGTVLDGKKQGVAGAKVTLTWGYGIQDAGTLSSSTRVEVVKTDAKGAYVFEGWWPKERYYVTVEGEGFGKVGGDFNAWKVGEPGSTITFEPFIVNPLKLDIAGQVQHLDGTPVVGATVQTCGETPKPITATTDAEGRYTLKGLPEMTLFVTVAKPGYRPTYITHNATQPSLNLTLRRSTEPPAPAPVISEKFLAERKQTMIDILEMLWPKRVEHGYGSLLFDDMQRLDPARAQAWAEAATGDEAANLKKRLQAQIAEPELVKLALEDADEAIARIGKTRNAPYDLRNIAGKVMAKDKAVALKLIEEATILSRKLLAQDPMRLPFNLGECAALAHQAGNVGGAKKLFAEATELVDKIADVKNRDIARSWLAAPLGMVDLAAAKEQLSKCEDPYYHNSSVSKILVHIAKTDSQAAIDNLKLLKTDRSRAHFTEKLLIAATIAEREPDVALKLVESIETTVDRVRGYMELARLFAHKDKTKAWGLIDKAFDLMERDPTPYGSYGSSGGVAGAAAQVAHQAKKIDYPDVHSLIARLLLMRSQEGTFTNNYRSKTVLALVLTPIDPVLGRAVLKTMYTDEILLGLTAPGNRDILFVLAMSDPAMCKKVVEMKLSKVKNSENMMYTGIVEMLSGMSVTGREIESLSPYASGMYRPLSEER